MSITTTCPQCQSRLEITDDLADQPIRCQRCLHTFERNGKQHADGIQPGQPPKTSSPKRVPDDEPEPMPTPRRPTARPVFPWSPILIVALGILLFLFVVSAGFNVWFITNPDRRFGAREAELQDMARQQAIQAEMAAQQARLMAEEAQRKEAAMQRQVEDLQRQLQAAREEVDGAKKK
jgi:predicted Zn finger-like uncharacterized protein